jgi:hypothetical protein
MAGVATGAGALVAPTLPVHQAGAPSRRGPTRRARGFRPSVRVRRRIPPIPVQPDALERVTRAWQHSWP